MSLMSLSIHERVDYLLDLLSCIGTIYHWIYDENGNLLETNCPDRVLSRIFTKAGCMASVLEHFKESTLPIMLSISYGLNWFSVLETEDASPMRVHVFGPTSTSEMSFADIHRITQSSNIPSHWRSRLVKIFEKIPAVSTIDMFRYIIMFHYCVTGDRITTADIVFSEPEALKNEKEPAIKKDRMKTYMLEQALMRMISEGDLNYKSIINNAGNVSSGVHMNNMGTLDQIKISQVVFISLATRAAISGGISPEIAYSRGDAYIQDIMDCRTVADAAHIGHSMYDDFVHLVHNARVNPNLSKQVQSCCDYIELHADEKLTLSEIAKRVGYTDYYLSRKFKQETGFSINDYIKIVKIERAKTMLLASDMSIQEICDQLNFGSRSFFAEIFKEIAGIPPAEFRNINRKM